MVGQNLSVLFVCSGDGVLMKEEEEERATWVAGTYKCASCVEKFWYYCDGTHPQSCWLIIALL
jgi:hypothetical protein